ncbi:hypothetical protein MCOR07_007955 [Pyricularia oryzae]|nr:hypothetical protein MCOR19_006397 [Pyricularia oryzae]KAI6455465.1 hypothetical protein MCOR17_008667 [Pyricularia oryzae]KAI6527122.1 hypothetical protein MCOR16_005859 [Pyricularia oryzae]KAI6615825.1 hypothetical protein MCOR07_007955 [Pyricularia oryzae]
MAPPVILPEISHQGPWNAVPQFLLDVMTDSRKQAITATMEKPVGLGWPMPPLPICLGGA